MEFSFCIKLRQKCEKLSHGKLTLNMQNVRVAINETDLQTKKWYRFKQDAGKNSKNLQPMQ